MSETIIPAGGPERGKPVRGRPSFPSGFDRRWLSVLGLLVVVVGVFVYLHGGQSKDLAETGGSTRGLVEGYQSGTGSGDRILVIDYTVAKVDYRARISLDPSIPTYATGKKVTVYYNPSHPTDIAVDGHSNQSPKKPLALAAILVVLGAGLVVAPFLDGALPSRARRFGT